MTDVVWTVEDHLAGKPGHAVALYRAFEEIVSACGPHRLAVSKSTITFKGSRRGFAGAHPTRSGLRGYLDLQRAVDDARITAVAPYTSRLWVHHFTGTDPAELDEDFREWVAEAYAVGAGDHLR